LRRDAEVRRWADLGLHSAEEGRFDLAASQYATALRLGENDSQLTELLRGIDQRRRRALKTKEVRDKVDEFLDGAERLRFSLLGFSGDPEIACRSLETALAKFSIPDRRDWMREQSIDLLDQDRRIRLISDVNELLFLWVRATDGDARTAGRAVQI